jgi:hypothetical protein
MPQDSVKIMEITELPSAEAEVLRLLATMDLSPGMQV